MATDYSQLTPEQQSAIAKYAAATYGTSPKALGMVQQKLAQDPEYANQQLMRFGYKVGVDTEGVNQFAPMQEGRSYDQDIRNSLAADEPEAVDNKKEEKAEQAGVRGSGKNGGGGGPATAKGSLPVPTPKPGDINGKPANGPDAIAAPVASNNGGSDFTKNATDAALTVGAVGGGITAGLIAKQLMQRGIAPDEVSAQGLAQQALTSPEEFLKLVGPANQDLLEAPRKQIAGPPGMPEAPRADGSTINAGAPEPQRAIAAPMDPMERMIMEAASRGNRNTATPPDVVNAGPPPQAQLADPRMPAGTPLLPPPNPNGGPPIITPPPPRQPIPGASPDAMIQDTLNRGGGDPQAAMGRAKMLLDAGQSGPVVRRILAAEYGPDVVDQVMQAASQSYPQARIPITAGVDTPPSEPLDAGLQRVVGRAAVKGIGR